MRLELSKKVVEKIEYFSKFFSSKEWSGPAWYKVSGVKDEFPEKFELKHFHPLDLGSHSATEIDSKEVAKILVPTYKAIPSLKSCYIGLIHSHHGMGAFFSATDTGTLEEMAPDTGFYPSLVVATAKDPYAFAVSYRDQYGYPQCIETDEVVIPEVKKQPEWENICQYMSKRVKQAVVYNGNRQKGHYQQGNLTFPAETKAIPVSTEKRALVDDLVEQWNDGKLNYWEFKEECDKIGIDPYAHYGWGYNGGYNGII